MIQLEENQLRHLLTTSAEMGAKAALTGAGLLKTEITKADAYRRFSRRSVDEWVAAGKITPVRRGSKTLLSVVALEILAKTNQLYKTHLKKIPVG